MAVCGIGFNSCWESIDFMHNSSKTPRCFRSFDPKFTKCKQNWAINCAKSELNQIKSVPIEEKKENNGLGHVRKFKISDFVICDSVCIGLGGRGGEVVFEAIVRNSECHLYNKRVVLRRFTSIQAQRRGRRSVEVLKKLARRKLLYHSYSMQVHGYVDPSDDTDQNSFTLVHGYHGSYSLRHWLQLSNWLPTLEATLALDEERVRKVGDDTVGGPAVSRLLRIIRVVMRDLLIGVNYLHSHGLAHTELRLENVHISPLDHHIKVGILGNAADFYESSFSKGAVENNIERRQNMIAFDMRCVGFMMAKMVLRELMDPLIFRKFKTFLTKGNDPSCLREFLLPILSAKAPSENVGLQILDRNWGAGWNLLSLLLATKSKGRISCLDALRHPFLCGPRWRVDPSMDLIRWGLGSTAVRITEEYIYGKHQRSRLAHFIELMETLNPFPRPKNWLKQLPGRWRLLYSTGRHIGLTFREPSTRVLIGDVHLTVTRANDKNTNLKFTSNINFNVILNSNWPHEKTGINGNLQVTSIFRLTAGRRLYLKEEGAQTNGKWSRGSFIKATPWSLPVAKLISGEIEVCMSLDDKSLRTVSMAQSVLKEVRTQIPPEMFDLSKLVCGTYSDSRLLVLRGVDGSALFFTRSSR
ncbi:putative plastid-lipid-associated protein 14 [Ranunculus cassubicifolius]